MRDVDFDFGGLCFLGLELEAAWFSAFSAFFSFSFYLLLFPIPPPLLPFPLAFITTRRHLRPAPLPFLPPGEGAIADYAEFGFFLLAAVVDGEGGEGGACHLVGFWWGLGWFVDYFGLKLRISWLTYCRTTISRF